MLQAADIPGIVFQGAGCTCLARVLGEDAAPLVPADISEARYTVFELDPADPNAAQPVAGHDDVSLAPASVLFDALQLDARWDVDSVGYNFRHALDVAGQPAFPAAERFYRVQYRLLPASGRVIVVRFRIHAI